MQVRLQSGAKIRSNGKRYAAEEEEEGGYMVRTRNYVANDDQKNRAVRNAGHHP
jgi:hypothetical protein